MTNTKILHTLRSILTAAGPLTQRRLVPIAPKLAPAVSAIPCTASFHSSRNLGNLKPQYKYSQMELQERCTREEKLKGYEKKKRAIQVKNAKRARKAAKKPTKELDGSAEETLQFDIEHMLPEVARESALEVGAEEGAEGEGEPTAGAETTPAKPEKAPLPPHQTVLTLTIHTLSSSGDGLAYSDSKDHVYLVPFTIPGDVVEAKVYKHFKNHSLTDFIKVVTPSPKRDDSLIGCKYFAECGGCQFQMMPYEEQLLHKKHVVEKAFENYSGLEPTLIPEIGPTWASPLKYGYRTKLTPHFDGPRKGGFPVGTPTPEIGFQKKGTRRVIDIEDCPIGTPALREGLTKMRKYVDENLQTYKRGATILLRESTARTVEGTGEDGKPIYKEEKTCITEPTAVITEYIGDYKFESPAGSFFQNNNSILEEFTTFIRSNLYAPPSSDPTLPPPTQYLVDAYCGSGLFSITCGAPFTAVIGIDISPEGIQFATRNALANNLTKTTFIQGDAERIFEKITFPGENTTVIIDPPRKGSDKKFLDQLLDLRPKRIVYISCNVHTQARDLGYFLKSEKGVGYKIDSIRGFDFFPQTHHVESIAVLTRYTST